MMSNHSPRNFEDSLSDSVKSYNPYQLWLAIDLSGEMRAPRTAWRVLTPRLLMCEASTQRSYDSHGEKILELLRQGG